MIGRIAVAVALWTAGAVHAGTCVDRAAAVTRSEAAKTAAEAAYHKALAAKKLKPISLPMIAVGGGDGRYLPADYKSFVVQEVDDGHGGKVHVLTDIQGSCGGPQAELVQQGTKIFRVERKPRVHVKTLETCQCTYLDVHGCGLAASAHAVGHLLPPGTKYAGTVTVAYDQDDIRATHAQPCPPPPPIP
ncbi:MAG: hypothetical protein ACM31C_18195 [Acidobacteriota bacterium]